MKAGDVTGMESLEKMGILRFLVLRVSEGSETTVKRVLRFVALSDKERAMRRGILKVFTLAVVLAFSYSSFAVNLIACEGKDLQEYNEYKPAYDNDPGNVRKIYNMSVRAICVNKMQEGMALLEKSADGGHVQANYFMGVYYQRDKSFDTSKPETEDPKHFNAMLFYYNRAANLIASNPQYPEGTYKDIPYLEEHNRISAKVFVALPNFYFNGYTIAIGKILNDAEKTEYTDTLEVLRKMRDSAKRCLARPALSVWKHKQREIGHAMQVRCGASWDFAEGALPLEQKRLSVARQCIMPLKECPEHQKIIDTLISLVNNMMETLNSVPLTHYK